MSVRIITDSTAYLPPEVLARHRDVVIVPLDVIIDGRSIVEGSAGSAELVAEALQAGRRVTTSRPSPQAFSDAYTQAAADGATELVSVHLSGALSATVDGARTAAAQADLPVRVVDSGLIGMGMGYAVCAADRAAQDGASVDEVVAVVADRVRRTSTYFYVDTLEYLRRGGRLGAASAVLGTALSVKPILTIESGGVVIRDRVRTAGRAIERLGALSLEAVAGLGGHADLAVHHVAAGNRVDAVTDWLSQRLPDTASLLVTDLGAVVGAHVGPGAVAVTISPSRGSLAGPAG